MMEFFNISPDNENWGHLYDDNLEGRHKWRMPGVHCHVCQQTWALFGATYPLVDLSSTSIGSHLEIARVVEIEEYESLQQAIEKLVPKGLPIIPGTTFGPLVGKITGTFGDFVWLRSWEPLVKFDVYEKLNRAGVQMPATSSPQLQKKVIGQLLELQIELHGYLSPLSFSKPDIPSCPRCNRDKRKISKVVMARESIPSDLDMFRISDFPTMILVSQRFKAAVEQNRFNNVRFEQVDIE